MKNPFAMMALMAAAMTEAFRENKYREAGIELPKGRGRSRVAGKSNPAGAKQLIRFYKAKHGTKPDDLEEARTWYASYLAEKDAAAVDREERRRKERAMRSSPMKLAA